MKMFKTLFFFMQVSLVTSPIFAMNNNNTNNNSSNSNVSQPSSVQRNVTRTAFAVAGIPTLIAVCTYVFYNYSPEEALVAGLTPLYKLGLALTSQARNFCGEYCSPQQAWLDARIAAGFSVTTILAAFHRLAHSCLPGHIAPVNNNVQVDSNVQVNDNSQNERVPAPARDDKSVIEELDHSDASGGNEASVVNSGSTQPTVNDTESSNNDDVQEPHPGEPNMNKLIVTINYTSFIPRCKRKRDDPLPESQVNNKEVDKNVSKRRKISSEIQQPEYSESDDDIDVYTLDQFDRGDSEAMVASSNSKLVEVLSGDEESSSLIDVDDSLHNSEEEAQELQKTSKNE